MSDRRSIAAITDDLVRLGVSPGRAVMVHASLRAIGPVEDGAAGVVRALDAAVGAGGTLMMVLGAADPWAWVNERPEAERPALLASAEPFNPLATPAEADVGALAEVFRTTSGTLVSNHPEGRFAARGAGADALLRDVPWDDYYGPGSPLARLVERGGHVLRLGADTHTVTVIHYAEYLADVPDKRRVRRHRRVDAAGGPVIRTVDCLDDSAGIVEWPGEDYFATILGDFLATGAASRGVVGQADSELMDARELVAFAARWMSERFRR